MDSLSASGTNPSIPDMSPGTQERHAKHLQDSKSYPGMSIDEYVKKSSELVRSKIGGDIDGYKASDGAIVRYNKATNNFAKGYATDVAAMFKPTDGEEYFRRQMFEDGDVQND